MAIVIEKSLPGELIRPLSAEIGGEQAIMENNKQINGDAFGGINTHGGDFALNSQQFQLATQPTASQEQLGCSSQLNDPPHKSERKNSMETENSTSLPQNFAARKTKEKNYLLAATCIEDARYGRTLEYNTDETSLLNYRKYSNVYFHWCTILILWLLLALALFEEPAVDGIAIPFWGTAIIEVFCLAVIGYRLYQMMTFVPRRAFLTDPKNIVVATTIVFTLLDMIVYVGMKSSKSSADQALRVSRALRPLFLINMNESRQVRRAFRNIRNTVPEIINVLILFIFSIALFTLLAFKLFEFRELYYRTGEEYFTDYGDAFFDLYVLVTTANSPDVMMPAYDDSPWFALFFIVYIITNTYIFINLFLAVIYNSYRAHLKTEIRSSVNWKRKKLEQAFELLVESDEHQVITSESWMLVMKNMARPPSVAKTNLYWEVLIHGKEEESEATISKEDFLQVANLLNVYIVQDTSFVNSFARIAPEVYNSWPSKFVRKCVRHRYFVYFFDLLIVANAICIGLNWEVSEWFFLSIFMLEILLRIYTLGPREYFSLDNLWNWFDFLIITAALIATLIEASLDELAGFPREALDFLLVIRCLRLLKIVSTIERFRVIVMTILNIAPSLAIYGVVLLMIYYFFAIVGMESFGGKIIFVKNGTLLEQEGCGNEKLVGSEFVRVGYCSNNFNDLLRSLVTLIELTVVNQWHVIALGFTLVTNKAARLYFVLFHMIVVILIMNIIVAFVLEAFILEYSLSQTNIESKVEKTIENLGLMADENIDNMYTDRTTLVMDNNQEENREYGGMPVPQLRGPRHRFRINRGHKNVEILLQRMFEHELEDDGKNKETQHVTLDDAVLTTATI